MSTTQKEANNMLLQNVKIPGVTLKVRNQDEYMNASLDKLGKYLAKKELAARNTTASDIDESKSMDDFYSRGNKVD